MDKRKADMKRNIKDQLRDYLHAKGVKITHNDFIQCLWHDDKNPSCKVNDDYVHCFACKESGDIYTVASALIGVPCDREHFREIATDVEKPWDCHYRIGSRQLEPYRGRGGLSFLIQLFIAWNC